MLYLRRCFSNVRVLPYKIDRQTAISMLSKHITEADKKLLENPLDLTIGDDPIKEFFLPMIGAEITNVKANYIIHGTGIIKRSESLVFPFSEKWSQIYIGPHFCSSNVEKTLAVSEVNELVPYGVNIFNDGFDTGFLMWAHLEERIARQMIMHRLANVVSTIVSINTELLDYFHLDTKRTIITYHKFHVPAYIYKLADNGKLEFKIINGFNGAANF